MYITQQLKNTDVNT